MPRNVVRVGLVLALLIMMMTPAPAQAAGGSADLVTTATGSNWQVVAYDASVGCAHLQLWYNYTSFSATHLIGIWMMSPEAGASRSALIFGDPVESRVHLEVTGTDLLDIRYQVLGLENEVYFDLGTHCGFRRFAMAAPTAADAHLSITFTGSPGVSDAYGGNDAFAATADDFDGTKVEAGVPVGASAAALARWSTEVDAGLMAIFASPNQAAWLQVTDPDGNAYGGPCTGVATAGLAACPASSLGNIGRGIGPAGTWDFDVVAEAGGELLHVYAVGAPLDWGHT